MVREAHSQSEWAGRTQGFTASGCGSRRPLAPLEKPRAWRKPLAVTVHGVGGGRGERCSGSCTEARRPAQARPGAALPGPESAVQPGLPSSARMFAVCLCFAWSLHASQAACWSTAANTSLTLGGRQFLSSSLSPILSRVFTAKCSLSESPPCPVSLLGSKPLKLGAGRALSLCFSASIISMECLTGNKGFF